ncbi:cytochrome c-type biogenesis protein CcmH [Vibrio sp. V27_P1S3P104]|uniref:cytochrome c-type biogenesis protein n=1 Tax=Vibrio TaxID=662 RepID=UPI000C168A0A|nr:MULTISPECIES: cytochrome c-type biogenesis protein [Vibrio]NAW68733.1 cytochrome c-type biogenesis protein CcmH [Vibrio sp. V28_P6S34P95]NAX04558.1 cytochrome c-type biogenesis protein CcmH [Vibrio sp. V30_P3S12P165]NAX33545.1 cytochrome c-type biogenesis protein CcmH [Vibrio sp. V29_P1S30P107]NAX38768.1 cytochrome c-type biogenesis protein CcmH [Vibrio sp. V27_P1S3P104]NAX40989.1 cytochrome c-type biogenesis protein CcmH [Vibrio sp. V26_P1S5P106]
MRLMRWATFATLFLSLSSWAVIDVYDFDTPEQEKQFHELSNTLRCPKCQNNSIADSNAELAQDLRQKVYEMTKQGHEKQTVIDYMVARYGNFVTYNPPLTASTAILWIAPLLVLMIGFSVLVMRSRGRKNHPTQVENWDQEKEARLQALLKDESQGDKQA